MDVEAGPSWTRSSLTKDHHFLLLYLKNTQIIQLPIIPGTLHGSVLDTTDWDEPDDSDVHLLYVDWDEVVAMVLERRRR